MTGTRAWGIVILIVGIVLVIIGAATSRHGQAGMNAPGYVAPGNVAVTPAPTVPARTPVPTAAPDNAPAATPAPTASPAATENTPTTQAAGLLLYAQAQVQASPAPRVTDRAYDRGRAAWWWIIGVILIIIGGLMIIFGGHPEDVDRAGRPGERMPPPPET